VTPIVVGGGALVPAYGADCGHKIRRKLGNHDHQTIKMGGNGMTGLKGGKGGGSKENGVTIQGKKKAVKPSIEGKQYR